MLKAEDFKIRCSKIGSIMKEPRSKADKDAGKLGETAKSYCEQWLKIKLYGKYPDVIDKKIAKGRIVENEAIQLIADHLKLGFVLKNEEHFSSDFIEGTPDIILPDCVIDNKASWDCFTFPLFDSIADIDTDYYYQLQGYMHITGRRKAKLVYTLMNTPEHIAERDINFKLRLQNIENDELTVEMFEKEYAHYDYSSIEPKYRVKTFDFEYDESVIKKVEEQVIKCRNYISQLLKSIQCQ